MKLVAALVVSCVAAACRAQPEQERAQPPASAPQATAVPKESAPAPEPATSDALNLGPQPGWVVETPSSAMRKAQYRLPHVGADAQDATLVVYFFAGQGGGAQANIDRWTAQFEQPDGRASADVLETSERDVNGIRVLEVDLSGTYVAETAPGSNQRVHEPGWRMLAAIVSSAPGPHYVKLVGPAATVAHWESSYRRFISSIH
jgi:hypothetical protein